MLSKSIGALAERIAILSAAVAAGALFLAGCGSGGGALTTGGASPASTEAPAGQGRLELRVAFADPSREIPQMDSILIDVFGEGLVTPKQFTATPTSPAVSAWVPVGAKTILGRGMQQSSFVVAIGATFATVTGGATPVQRTLLMQHASGFDAIFNGTKDLGNQTIVNVLRWSDGREDYLNVDRQPPLAGPANVLWFGMLNPPAARSVAGPVSFAPPVPLVPAVLDRSAPVVVDPTVVTHAGGTTTGRWTCAFEGWEGVPWGNYSSNSVAARIRTTFEPVPPDPLMSREMVDWYLPDQGPQLRIELDPALTDADPGYVRDIFYLTGQSGTLWWGTVQPLFPMADGAGYSYLASRDGGHEVHVQAQFFGVRGAEAIEGGNAVRVWFTQSVDPQTAAIIANYGVKVNGVVRPVTAVVVSTTDTTMVTLTLGGNPLAVGEQIDGQVQGVSASDGTPLPPTPPYNDFHLTVKAQPPV